MSRGRLTTVEGIEHNGHYIRYDEAENTWECGSLSLKSDSLKALRSKINALDAEVRRVDNVKAFTLGSYGFPEPCVITMIVDDKKCWVVKTKERSSRLTGRRTMASEREQCSFDSIALDTPDVRAAIRNWEACRKAEQVAECRTTQALKDIPTITRAQLLELKVAKAEEEA